MYGDLEFVWMIILGLIIIGVSIGITVAVVVSFLRLGWKLAPYIAIGAALIWFFGGV